MNRVQRVYYHGFWRYLHGTLYSWDPGRIISSLYRNFMRIKMVFSAKGTGTKKPPETTYILQFNYHFFWLSSIKVFCAMQLT